MIVRHEDEVDMESYILYITDNNDEDSLVELENISFEDALEDAMSILKLQKPPSVITLFGGNKENELKVIESEVDNDGNFNIISHPG